MCEYRIGDRLNKQITVDGDGGIEPFDTILPLASSSPQQPSLK
jgi:hypothetical protein